MINQIKRFAAAAVVGLALCVMIAGASETYGESGALKESAVPAVKNGVMHMKCAYALAVRLTKEAKEPYIVKTCEGDASVYDRENIYEPDVKATTEDILDCGEKQKTDPAARPEVKFRSKVKMSPRVEVSIKTQTLYLIKNGKVILKTPVVTGNAYTHPTDKGVYRIDFMTTDTILRGKNDDGTKYASKVRYWMPFNGGQGLHDAEWRYNFGGGIYMGGGSHGCVNLPADAAEKIYSEVTPGTVVTIF